MLNLRTEAEDDIKEAYDWYENQRQFLGNEFLTEIEATLKKIHENPQLYAHVYRTIRRALCKRFPYAIYYLEDNTVIHVLAILQQRRRPEAWKKRK